MVGLMVTSSKRAYSIARSTASRAPAPEAIHCSPVPLQEMLKHSSVSVSVDLWVLVCTKFVWALWTSLVGIRFDSKHDFAPPTVFLGLLLCPYTWVISSKSLQHHAASIPAPAIFWSSLTLDMGNTVYTVSQKKKRLGADYSLHHELLIAKFRLK